MLNNDLPSQNNGLFGIPKSVWGIGLVTLLMNLSTIVIFSLSPKYLTTVLGISVAGLGIFEGLVEFSSWLTRVFAGIISDFLSKRKPILLFAYSIAAFSRPIFAIAHHVNWIFFARTIDRIGNGLQATPREALVGDHSPKSKKGACYGMRQTLGMTGSLIGAALIIYWITSQGEDYVTIFWLASIPPILAVLVLIFMVKESPIATKNKASNDDNHEKKSFTSTLKNIGSLRAEYWRVVFVGAFFMLSNYSGAFMILQANSIVGTLTIAPQIMVVQNFMAMLAAFPIGKLSDKVDRRYLLAIGFTLVIIANLFFAYATSAFEMFIGAGLWGIQMGITQSLLMAKVADTTPKIMRGTGFGCYFISVGLMLYISNQLTGYLYDLHGPKYAFITSSIIAGLACLSLPLIKPSKKLKTNG